MSSGRKKLRIGTRGSHLARTQSATVAAELQRLGHDTELVIVRTSGDQSDAPSFSAIGTQGVFVREIEQALLDDVVDLAVHSYKDLPTASPGELLVAAVPPRMDAADVLVMRAAAATGGEEPLPIRERARVGTASARRQSWLAHLRPDLTVEPLRGNVPTRLGRLDDGFDAVVLAAAGLERLRASPIDKAPELALEQRMVARLAPEVFVPAPAQGALALQCRTDDEAVRGALSPLDDSATRRAVGAERALLARAEGGCELAFGAYCAGEPGAGNGELTLIALLERDGALLQETARGADPEALAESVWEALRRR